MEDNQNKMRDATIADVLADFRQYLSNTKIPPEVAEAIACYLDRIKAAANRERETIESNALAAQARVCDVNTLESLSDFVEHTILTSDLLKDADGIVKGIVMASVRTALTVAYAPTNSELKKREGDINGSK